MADLALLVHGTFDADAPWIQADSLLASTLTSTAAAPLHVAKFDWNGSNSFSERRAAADRLAGLVDAHARANPGGRVHIVAHSHGGNIALLAAEACDDPRRVASITTLGTPFIALEPKLWPSPGLLAVAVLLWGVLLAIAVGEAADYAWSLVLLLPVAGAAWLMHRRAVPAALRAEQTIRRHSSAATSPRYPNPLLCVAYNLDEARLWLLLLSVFRGVEALVGWTYHQLYERGLRRTYLTVALLMAPFWWAVYSDVHVMGLDNIDLATVLLGPFLAAWLSPLLLLPLSVLGTALSSHRFGLSGSLSLQSLFVDVSISGVPRGLRVTRERFSAVLGNARARAAGASGFSRPHSLGYLDPKAIETICRFVNEAMAARPTRSDSRGDAR